MEFYMQTEEELTLPIVNQNFFHLFRFANSEALSLEAEDNKKQQVQDFLEALSRLTFKPDSSYEIRNAAVIDLLDKLDESSKQWLKSFTYGNVLLSFLEAHYSREPKAPDKINSFFDIIDYLIFLYEIFFFQFTQEKEKYRWQKKVELPTEIDSTKKNQSNKIPIHFIFKNIDLAVPNGQSNGFLFWKSNYKDTELATCSYLSNPPDPSDIQAEVILDYEIALKKTKKYNLDNIVTNKHAAILCSFYVNLNPETKQLQLINDNEGSDQEKEFCIRTFGGSPLFPAHPEADPGSLWHQIGFFIIKNTDLIDFIKQELQLFEQKLSGNNQILIADTHEKNLTTSLV